MIVRRNMVLNTVLYILITDLHDFNIEFHNEE